MLDYDGTLAPFQPARDLAVPLPRSRELLSAIAGLPGMQVAIVSGRPIAELERWLGPLPATLVGEHGWEMREPDGTLTRHPLPTALVEQLDRAKRAAGERGLGERLERKRTGIVLHTRGLAAGRAHELEEQVWTLWRAAEDGGAVFRQRTDGGVELRARGRDKGSAVRSLVSRAPAGTLAVYVGDDATDEDAFAAVRDRGFGVRVGEGDRPTQAFARLPTSGSVVDFLEEWLRRAGDESK
jgi:trehalose-phosphatase